MVRPGPIVSAVPPVGRRRALHVPWLPNTTVPLPPKVWLPIKFTDPYQLLVGLPTCSIPLTVRPSSTVRLALLTLAPTSQFPLNVTPSSVPLLTSNTAPPPVVIVPPSTVPPASTQEPLAAFNVNVALVL